MRLLLLFSLVLSVCGCGTVVRQTPPQAVGDKQYVVLEVSTRRLFGANLRVLHTLEIDPEGKAKLVNTSAATASGIFQAVLPGGVSSAVPVSALLPLGQGGSR